MHLLGPSLGTSAPTLWGDVAARLGDDFHVLGWELPGHGGEPVGEPFTLAELAAGVRAYAEGVLATRGDQRLAYAGDSVGDAVGLQLLLDAPGLVSGTVLLCTGARIGTPESWAERAATVRASGTAAVLTSSAERWFAPGFLERSPEVGAALLHALEDADREGYAQVCKALAGFDVRDRLAEIEAPVLAVAGAHDVPAPPASLQEIADGVRDGRLVVLDDVAHLAPAEAPDRVAALLRRHPRPSPTLREVYDAGMVVRREVIGDAHDDRATAAATPFTEEFQELNTQCAWGTIWTRPGLDRRSRSLVTLTALIARGHHEELAMHVRAALRNGLTRDEIKEVILQSAIYCGVPDANTVPDRAAGAGLVAEGPSPARRTFPSSGPLPRAVDVGALPYVSVCSPGLNSSEANRHQPGPDALTRSRAKRRFHRGGRAADCRDDPRTPHRAARLRAGRTATPRGFPVSSDSPSGPGPGWVCPDSRHLDLSRQL